MAAAELFERCPHHTERRGEHSKHSRIAMLALVEVADRGHDVETADPVSRECHHDEGQQDAHADRDDQARPLEVERQGDAFVEPAEHGRQHADHQGGHAHPQHDADDTRSKRVSGALEQEHLSEVSSLQADGAAHAHLGSPLGRKHDEDQEDQKHADSDREEADAEQRTRDEHATLLRERDGISLVGGVDVQVELARDVVVATQLVQARSLRSPSPSGPGKQGLRRLP